MPGREGNKRAHASRAWQDSFLACRSLLSRVVGRYVRPQEIEDIVQEAFVRSYAAARKQRIREPRAFMLRTARNLALNSLKRADVALNRNLDGCTEAEALTERITPELECESQEEFLVFCRAVSALPVQCRRAFILKKVYGLSQKEIAGSLEISESTVEKHIAKGMLLTARYMEDRTISGGTRDAPLLDASLDEAQSS